MIGDIIIISAIASAFMVFLIYLFDVNEKEPLWVLLKIYVVSILVTFIFGKTKGILYWASSIVAEGEFGPDQMRPDKLTSPLILKHAKKVSLEIEPQFSKFYPASVCCEVVVQTQNGKVVSADAQQVEGDWDMPLSDEDLKNKFARLCRNRLAAEQIETAIDQIYSAESLDSIPKFINALHHALISN